MARVRLRVLTRDGYRCQRCGRYGNQVDHVIPLHLDGPAYDMGNLQVLCSVPCHRDKTTAEHRRYPPTIGEAEWIAWQG